MRLLTSADVQNVLNIKRSKLYQMIRSGEFPKAHGSAKTKRWLDIEVDCFLAFFCGQIADNEIFSAIPEERFAEIRMCAERARKLA